MDPATVAGRVRTVLARRSGIDPRGLAAFRAAVGSILVVDLALRARHLGAFYTDAGVLPRSVLFEYGPAYGRFSLHALSGAGWFQALLFALAGLAALALAVGYRTRAATVASLALLGSLHARNPVVLNGGDALLLFLLLWSAFLPLGLRWSVDALRRGNGGEADEPRTRPVTGVAPAALLVQVVLVYLANAALKLQGEAWIRGDAIRYVFSLDQFTVLLGDVLAEYPTLLVALDRGWLALLIASPLLFVATGRARTVLAAAFATGHLGLAITMQLGVFPLVSVAALLPFAHAGVWDAVAARVPSGEAIHGRFPTLRAWGRRALAPIPDPTSNLGGRRQTVPPGVAGVRRRVGRGVVATLLVAMVLWNAATVGVVGLPSAVTDVVDPEDHRWDMFAPEPMGVDAWYVVPGRLESGGRVDALHGGAVEWDRPPDVSATYPTARWRKYLTEVRTGPEAYQRALADYLCRRWNRNHAEDLTRVRVTAVEQPTRLSGPEPTRRVTLTERACRGRSRG